MAHPEQVQPPVGENDSDLEAKAANNFALVNERVLSRIEGEVVNSRFTVAMTIELPPTAVVLRAVAVGLDDTDQPFDAVGAHRLPDSKPLNSTP